METMDGPIEWEDDIPPIPIKTPEEKAEELERYYPRSDKATYLKYTCHFCLDTFFLISPFRSREMNPYSEGFIIRTRSKTQDSNNKRIMPACRKCLLDLRNRRENAWTNHEYDK
jgi:hypothetical protein